MNVENNYKYVISYGKAQVPVYRMYAPTLTGVSPIPESAFIGRGNVLFAMEVDVEVFGENFLPAYTHGDNTMVVATDMKTTTPYELCDRIPNPRPNWATTIPTSPRGIIPTPTRSASVLPKPNAPRPQPMNFETTAAARITNANRAVET